MKPRTLAWLYLLAQSLTLPVVQGACATYAEAPAYPVAHVFDGDTLRLKDRRKVRLIGLNAPELGRDGKQDAPYAARAKAHLERLIHNDGGRIYLRLGADRQDRYRRVLAHAYAGDGENLTEQLLAAGMGYQIAVPPNLANLTCYAEAEARAREDRLGLWQHPPRASSALSAASEGFQRVSGRVQRVGHSRNNVWLNLEGGLALRIERDDLRWFEGLDLDRLQGRQIETRGWVYRRKGQQRMQIRHPSALRVER